MMLKLGDMVDFYGKAGVSPTGTQGIYVIIEEHKGASTTQYIGVLMFEDKKERLWIFPSQEGILWNKIT
jgi:hypothetical protein